MREARRASIGGGDCDCGIVCLCFVCGDHSSLTVHVDIWLRARTSISLFVAGCSSLLLYHSEPYSADVTPRMIRTCAITSD